MIWITIIYKKRYVKNNYKKWGHLYIFNMINIILNSLNKITFYKEVIFYKKKKILIIKKIDQ
jgi:hypothetical protein